MSATLIVSLAIFALLVGSLPVAAQAPTPTPPPLISAVKPIVAKPGERITIKGSNFIGVKAVAMAGVALPFEVKTKQRIEAQAPKNAARGAVSVSARGGVAYSPRMVVVQPSLRVSPGSGPIASRVNVAGSGFIPGESVDIYVGRLAQVTTTTDGNGQISASFLVPAKTAPGVTSVRALGRFSGVPVDRAFRVAASWPQRGLTAGGNRRSTDQYLGATYSASLILDWSAKTIGPSSSSPAVSGDLVVVGSDTGAVLVMPTDCASGGRSCTPRAIGVTRGAVRASPAIAGPLVFVASEDASVYAFDLACGEDEGPCDPVWSYETDGPITSSPATDGEVVVVGSSDGNVYAFDLTCGLESDPGAVVETEPEEPIEEPGCSPRWVGQTGGAISSSPAIHDGVAYIGSDDGFLHAFETDCAADRGSCGPLWLGWTGGFVRSSPAVANGMVYVGSLDAKVHGFATGCGNHGEVCQAIWRGDADAPIESSPVIADGYVVVGANDGAVMGFPVACADRTSGCAPTWRAMTGGAVRSSPAVSGAAQGGSMVFVGSDDGFLYAYPLKCRNTGKPALCPATWASGTSAPITASPSIVDGAVYVSSKDGTVRRWSLP